MPGVTARPIINVKFPGRMCRKFALVFCLLPDKTKATYIRMLRLLRNSLRLQGLVFEPPVFQIDFEVAAVQALQQEFPLCQVLGCLFYFSQYVWRKTQAVGLASAYQEQENVRRIAALPLIPIDMIDEAYIIIENSSPGTVEADKLLDYMVETWTVNTVVLFHRSPNAIGWKPASNTQKKIPCNE